jgi:hypothetical protein
LIPKGGGWGPHFKRIELQFRCTLGSETNRAFGQNHSQIDCPNFDYFALSGHSHIKNEAPAKFTELIE